MIGTVKVKNLSSLSINNPIKGYLPVFSNKGDKIAELLVALRILLPGSKLVEFIWFVFSKSYFFSSW